MHVAAVGPDEDVRVELVVLKRVGEHVELRKHDQVVVLERELRVVLVGEDGVLHSPLPLLLHERIVPKLLKRFYLLKHENGVIRLAPLPNISLELLSSEDDEVGVSL